MKIIVLILSLFSVFANADTAKDYHYVLRIPQTAQTCEKEAQDLGVRFATDARAKVTASVCRDTLNVTFDKKNYKLYSLLLTYQATQQISPYSAVFAQSAVTSTPGAGDGIYNTYADCNADMALQVKTYEAATGLVALGAFCIQLDNISYSRYKLQIDGIGTKKTSLYVFSPQYSGNVDATFLANVNTLVTKVGGKITKLYENLVFYYSKYPVNLTHLQFAMFVDKNECLAQITEATNILKAANAQNILISCFDLPKGMHSTAVLEAVHDGQSSLPQDYGVTYKYYSYSECMTDKPRVLQDAGKNAMGAICAPSMVSPNEYALTLYRHF